MTSSLLVSLLLNFCLLVTCAFVISLTYREGGAHLRLWLTGLRLILTAGAALLLGLVSVEVAGGFRIDLRYVPVALAVLFSGPVTGAVVAAPVLVWRLTTNTDPVVEGAIWLHFLSVLGLGSLARPLARPLLEELSLRRLWILPLPLLGVGLGLLLTPEGREMFWASYSLRVLLGTLGLLAALLIVQSRLRLLGLAQLLRTQASTDALTGLPNRRAFDHDLAELRPGDHLALLDLDHFKRVNDRYGHGGGDRALAQVGRVLRSVGGSKLRAYRVGGEEFAALLSGMGAPAAAQSLEALRAALSGQPGGWMAETGERLTFSVGLATRQGGEDGEALFRRADEALYLAKTNGRDRLVVWTPARPPPPERAVPSAPQPLRPRHSVWRSLRTTVSLLAQRRVLRDEDWAEILRLAVDAVDGASCGTLDIRVRGTQFRMVAAVGYSQSLVGLALTEESQRSWYGRAPEEWRTGLPRIVEGAALEQAYALSDADLGVPAVGVLSGAGRREEVSGNLCLPVVLGDEVVAHLNLDSLAGRGRLGPGSVETAQLFAQQVAALLHLQGRWDEIERLVGLHERVAVMSTGELAEELTVAAAELLRAQWATLLRYDAAQGALVAEGMGRYEPGLGPVHLPRGEGLAWAALEAGEVLRLADLTADARVYRREQLGPGAIMAVPLRAAEGGPLGALILTRPPGRPFSEADAHLALLLGGLAVGLLERAQHVVDLQTTLDAALETLGVAVKFRDAQTAQHTRRVTELAAAFGAALGFGPAQLRGLRQGAALHDIGKLAVPDAVLLKSGPLDSHERALVETHPERGAALAASIPFLHPEAHGVIRSHHERWNGAGYPAGLRGEAIPLEARLFALCDVYGALVSARPYARPSPRPRRSTLSRRGAAPTSTPR